MRGGRNARVDDNQAAIVRNALAYGCSVQLLSAVGGGCPDLLIGYRDFNLLIEIKNPKQPPNKRALTDPQVEWHKSWRGQKAVVETWADVERVLADVRGTLADAELRFYED